MNRRPDPHEKGVEWDYYDGVFYVTYAGLRSQAMYWEPLPERVRLWSDLMHAAERKVA